MLKRTEMAPAFRAEMRSVANAFPRLFCDFNAMLSIKIMPMGFSFTTSHNVEKALPEREREAAVN